jgi:hypothetical protein
MQNIEHLEVRRDEIVRTPGILEGDELREADKDHTHFHAAFSSGARRCQAVVRRFCSFIVFVVGLMMLGCATTHATLNVTAPSTVIAGVPFTITVTAVYEGNRDTAINSPIHFTSTDPGAVLPGDYYFTPSDAGSHTWTNGFILATPGTQTITGYIYDDASRTESGINGSAIITVSP